MKQKYFNITLIAFAFGAILMFSSCKTNQRGIVPCPSYSSIETAEEPELQHIVSNDNKIKPAAQ